MGYWWCWNCGRQDLEPAHENDCVCGAPDVRWESDDEDDEPDCETEWF
jgi:hypothetical protein